MEALDVKIGSDQLKKELKAKEVPYKSRYKGRPNKRQWEDYNGEQSEAKRAALAGQPPVDRIKRKKCCILISYSGVNYFGMQRNPEMKTIEEDLLKSMLKTNWIAEDAYQQAQIIQFQRAARTDKGVSAARQVVSLKLPDPVDLEALNADLPEQIRVMAVKRVTKGFNSKTNCDARTYTYTLPTIAFAAHGVDVGTLENYRVDAARIVELNAILGRFCGTQNFHNFTSRKEYMDPSAKRFIISFEAAEPFVMQSVEFCVLKVKGQSFMLHQIRKMIGLALAVLRGNTTIATMDRAFSEDRIDIPIAPGLGLVLDQVHYDRYNVRYGEDGLHETLTWEDVEPKIMEFFEKSILPTIVAAELKEQSMINWLETLSLHTFDVRVEEEKEGETGADDDVKSVKSSPTLTEQKEEELEESPTSTTKVEIL